MPCQSYESSPKSVYEGMYSRESDRNAKLVKVNNRLARLLCKTLNNLLDEEGEDLVVEFGGKDALRWINKHNEDDRKAEEARQAAIDAKKERDRKEKLRLETIASLTDEQRELLGLD